MSYRPGMSVRQRMFAVVLGVLLVSAGTASAVGVFDGESSAGTPPLVPLAPTTVAPLTSASAQGQLSGLALLQQLQASFREVAANVLPVVVKIDTTTMVNSRRRFRFSPQPSPPREFEQPGGTGSGVIVSQADDLYYVLTNNHVIENTNSIQVTLDDGRDFDAELVGRDVRQDIALVSFAGPRGLPVARLGDSSSLFVGDLVLAVGSPFGFQSTVTSGIVSALGRETSGGLGGVNIAEYIQTDAAINPGNSGGALANLQGEVIGINTWIASRGGGNVGVGFALPINAARRAISDFIETGAVRYGYLGVFVNSASDAMREALGVAQVDGALAWSVILDSPAARGDLRPGDWVTHVGSIPVSDSSDLVRAVGALEPDRESVFKVIRDGKKLELSVRVALRSDGQERTVRDWPGIFPVHLTDRLRAEFGLAANLRGMMVGRVNESSAAATAGLRRGDVVTHINGAAIRAAGDFYRAIGTGESGEYQFRIMRDGERLTIGFDL